MYNEGAGIERFHHELCTVLDGLGRSYEIIYCNDGSTDDTFAKLQTLAEQNNSVRILSLTRNFGKEIALTATLQAAKGKAIITLDADGQHPVELIPEFVQRWHKGSKVVVGIRAVDKHESAIKHYGSKLFYKLFNRFLGVKLTPGATDFRLVDQVVQAEFARITERNRITRGLIDWLGYEQEYIYFKTKPRASGESTYDIRKLFKLAIDSVVSLSISPLYITAYIGAFVLPFSVILGVGMVVNAIFRDPLHLHATGGAYLMVFVLFLVGILLVSQGIIGLYLSHIHTETQNRPLYIVDEAKSVRLT